MSDRVDSLSIMSVSTTTSGDRIDVSVGSGHRGAKSGIDFWPGGVNRVVAGPWHPARLLAFVAQQIYRQAFRDRVQSLANRRLDERPLDRNRFGELASFCKRHRHRLAKIDCLARLQETLCDGLRPLPIAHLIVRSRSEQASERELEIRAVRMGA